MKSSALALVPSPAGSADRRIGQRVSLRLEDRALLVGRQEFRMLEPAAGQEEHYFGIGREPPVGPELPNRRDDRPGLRRDEHALVGRQDPRPLEKFLIAHRYRCATACPYSCENELVPDGRWDTEAGRDRLGSFPRSCPGGALVKGPHEWCAPLWLDDDETRT